MKIAQKAPVEPKPVKPEPVYLRLTRELKELLGGDAFPAGSKFLTEREISKRFSVSRLTANKVLAGLAAEGWLEFRVGSGTYVRGGLLDYELNNLVSFTHAAEQAGKRPSTKVVRLEIITNSALDQAAKLALRADDPHEPFYLIERVRSTNRRPVILEKRFVRARLCPGLNVADLNGSIYDLWAQKYSLSITGARQTLRAVALDEKDAKSLGATAGEPAMWVEGIGFLGDGQPLWCERLIYRGDAYEFVNSLGRVPGSTASGQTLLLREAR